MRASQSTSTGGSLMVLGGQPLLSCFLSLSLLNSILEKESLACRSSYSMITHVVTRGSRDISVLFGALYSKLLVST